MSHLRAYLAGPDVFVRDPPTLAARKKAVCGAHGLVGVFPLDASLDLRDCAPAEAALRISRANETLIRSCQLVIAHITPFRGPSCDVGTAYEMGFARALGLAVFAYSNVTASFSERSRAAAGAAYRPNGELEDARQLQIESFGLADNLMLVGAAEDSGGSVVTHAAAADALYADLNAFERCVRLASQWATGRKDTGADPLGASSPGSVR